MCTLTLSILYI